MAERNASVPPWATWEWQAQRESIPRARRCCFDELAVAIARRVPQLGWLGAVNGTMPFTLQQEGHAPRTRLAGAYRLGYASVDAWLRGAAQVMIINNPLAGILIVTSLFFPSAQVGVHGALGLTGATLAAYVLELDVHARRSGLFGYNGLLVGMALATFLDRGESGWDAWVLVAVPVCGALSTLIQLALGNLLVPTFHTPPFTLAFNVTNIIALLAVAQFSRFHSPLTAGPLEHSHRSHDGSPDKHPDGTDPTQEALPEAFGEALAWLVRATFTAVGQVFLCDSELSGALIVGGMAVSSRIAATAAVVGALGGCLLALALGVPEAEVRHGLWGYNACLTVIAVFTFFVPSARGGLIALAAILLTVLLDGALRSWTAPTGAPIGTLPFCFASLVVLLTHSKIRGFKAVPLADVATAEDHLYAVRVARINVHRALGACASEVSCTHLAVDVDAPAKAGRDAGKDAGTDAGKDAGTDAGKNAGTDAGKDAGRPHANERELTQVDEDRTLYEGAGLLAAQTQPAREAVVLSKTPSRAGSRPASVHAGTAYTPSSQPNSVHGATCFHGAPPREAVILSKTPSRAGSRPASVHAGTAYTPSSQPNAVHDAPCFHGVHCAAHAQHNSSHVPACTLHSQPNSVHGATSFHSAPCSQHNSSHAGTVFASTQQQQQQPQPQQPPPPPQQQQQHAAGGSGHGGRMLDGSAHGESVVVRKLNEILASGSRTCVGDATSRFAPSSPMSQHGATAASILEGADS